MYPNGTTLLSLDSLPKVLAKVFFLQHANGSNHQIMESFAIFWRSILTRPIGDMLLGWIGVKYDRKQALNFFLFVEWQCIRHGMLATLPTRRVLERGPTHCPPTLARSQCRMAAHEVTCVYVGREGSGLYGSYVLAAPSFGTWWIGGGISSRRLVGR